MRTNCLESAAQQESGEIPCRFKCGRTTRMLGTRTCDFCHGALNGARDRSCLNAVVAGLGETFEGTDQAVKFVEAMRRAYPDVPEFWR